MAILFLTNSELKGSTFRSRLINFSGRDTSSDVFSLLVKNNLGTVIKTIEPTVQGNAVLFQLTEIESLSASTYMLEYWGEFVGLGKEMIVYETFTITKVPNDAQKNKNITISATVEIEDVVINLAISNPVVQVIGEGDGTGIVNWDSIQNKPTQFPPEIHNHSFADLQDIPNTFPPENHTHSYNDLNDKPTIPQPVDISGKQDVLVSGTNIKTVNGQGILGSGNIQIDGSGIGTAPATTFNPADNTNASTMKALSTYIFDESQEIAYNLTAVNSYLKPDGSILASTNWRTSEFIEVEEGKTYYYFGKITGTSARAVVGYNSSSVFQSILINGAITSVSGFAFTIPVGTTKIRICSFNDTPLKLSNGLSVGTKIKAEFLPESSVPGNGKITINKTWGAVGTSITSQDVSVGGYQTRILEVFSFTGYLNYGYSGHSLGGQTLTDTSSIINKSTSWVARDVYTMESITNDFKRNIPIGVRADYDNATGILTYFGALRAFKDKIISLNAGARVIVANCLKRNNAGYTSISSNTSGHTILDYEKALLEIALLNDWRFIDQNRESGITDDNLAFTTLDGLHPNNFGYRLVSKVWIREFWLLSKIG